MSVSHDVRQLARPQLEELVETAAPEPMATAWAVGYQLLVYLLAGNAGYLVVAGILGVEVGPLALMPEGLAPEAHVFEGPPVEAWVAAMRYVTDRTAADIEENA